MCDIALPVALSPIFVSVTFAAGERGRGNLPLLILLRFSRELRCFFPLPAVRHLLHRRSIKELRDVLFLARAAIIAALLGIGRMHSRRP